MSAIKLEQVLKQEITAIAKETEQDAGWDFDAKYQFWMFGEGKDECRYKLKRDHILNPERLLLKLFAPEPDRLAKRILDRLNSGLRIKLQVIAKRLLEEPVASSASNGQPEAFVEEGIAELLPELNNQLAEKELLFTKDEQKDFPGQDKASQEIRARLYQDFERSPSRTAHAVWNRVLLQEAFPGEIARIWDTLSGIYAWAHAHPRSALCLSGGGIRSATFGLGVVQGLARNELLNKFDYISTVSGGGYIGGWLSAWAQHCGLAKVLSGLKVDQTRDPTNTEPEPLKHLRQYSNYLTPKVGITSVDTWTLIATYVRNVALNWVVFIPMLAALLAAPRICLAILRMRVESNAAGWTLIAGAVLGVAAIVATALNRPSIRSRRKGGRAGKYSWLSVALLYLASVCFTAVWGWLQNDRNQFSGLLEELQAGGGPLAAAPFLLTGVGVHVLAWIVYFRNLKRGRAAEFFACVLSGLVAGLLLWRGAVAWHSNFQSAPNLELFVCLGTPYFLMSFLLSVFLFVGVTSHWTDDEDREWLARMGAWILLAGVAWGVFSTLVLFGPEWLMKLPRLVAALGGISGIVTLILSRSGLTAANKKEATTGAKKTLGPDLVLALAAPTFLAALVAALSLGTTWVLKTVPIAGKHWECDGATVLSEHEVIDLPFLATRLKEHRENDPASGYLWNRFDLPLQMELKDYDNSDAKAKALRVNLVSELNEIIEKEDLVATNAFWLETLSEEARRHLTTYQQLPAADRLNQRKMQHNRFLLEKAYPRELSSGRFDHRMITHHTPIRKVAGVALMLAAVSIILSWWIDINRFSLHGVYRNRLIRAYLGASNPNRHPNAFTGFDPADNLHMAALPHRPFHIVNMALNLVTGHNLAWQQRKAESFTASPLHAGSWRLGYRPVEEYASHTSRLAPETPPEDKSETGLTLGTAITISGAAASPNMGYHSSPVLCALMTLFNVRLGAWLGNPGEAGNDFYRKPAPRSALGHLALEMLGLTDDHARYVYLSDGGHFENLGLYEMVLRRCRTILVSDAGCDPKCALEDLGNALRKIRIDLGIPIEIPKEFEIRSRKDSQKSKYCALADIKYSAVDGEEAQDGLLIYIKPAIGGKEPKDIFNYKETSETFPHESTGDQWFSESQFESYRALGDYIVQSLRNGDPGRPPPALPCKTLEDLKARINEYLKDP